MKNKKFNLFITSNEVDNFGTTYSISKYSIYLGIISTVMILVLSLFGIYFIFFSNPKIVIEKTLLKDISQIQFVKDPVKPKNNSEFETSFITSVFDNNHFGIDINGSIGTKIYSPMNGRVIYSGFDKKFGNSIIISHKNGYITKYMHNKENFVKFGDVIKVDKPIAEMGNSGSAVKNEGIHLHFELWRDGEVINPSKYIKNLKVVDIDTFVSK